jgi:hypothetical protein
VLSTSGLLVLHFLTFSYFVVAVCVDVVREYYGVGCGTDCDHNSGAYGGWVTYLTNWSLTLIGLSALVAFINTARHLCRLRHSTTKEAMRMQKFETRFDRRSRGRHGQAIAGDIVSTGGQNEAQAHLQRNQQEQQQQQQQQQPQQLPVASADKLDVHAGATNAWAHLNWDWLSGLHLMLMELSTSAAFFVTFWYWVGVVGVAKENPGPPYAGTVLAHGCNVVFALLQVYLTRLPIVSYHYQVLLWYGTAYAVFLWIYSGVWGTWRYGLDWHLPRAVVAQILIPPITIIMFTIWYYVALVREGAVFTARKIKHEVVELRERHHEKHHSHADAQAAGDAPVPQQQQHTPDAAAIIVNDGQEPAMPNTGAGKGAHGPHDVEAGR